MNVVEYTLAIQKLFTVLTGLSFVAISAQLVFLDPNSNALYIWSFLLSIVIFLCSVISLLAFWWFFSVRKEILSIQQVNHLIYQSLISTCLPVLLIVMNQTGQLNFLSGILILVAYAIYFLWINSEGK